MCVLYEHRRTIDNPNNRRGQVRRGQVRRGQEMFCGCGRFRFIVRVIYGTAVFI